MEHRVTVSQLEILSHRLALVNAKLHEISDEKGNLIQERREIMELISRERLGQTQQIVWSPGDRFIA